jgi:hypothetical protein
LEDRLLLVAAPRIERFLVLSSSHQQPPATALIELICTLLPLSISFTFIFDHFPPLYCSLQFPSFNTHNFLPLHPIDIVHFAPLPRLGPYFSSLFLPGPIVLCPRSKRLSSLFNKQRQMLFTFFSSPLPHQINQCCSTATLITTIVR